MGYDPISDTELLPGKPITSSLLTRLRDNPEAVYIGDTGAPSILRKAISAGGTGQDGAWINTTVLTALGFFEPSSIVWTADRTMPAISIIRANGNVSITGAHTLTVPAPSDTERVIGLSQLRATHGDDGYEGGLTTIGSGGNARGSGGALVGGGGPGAISGGTPPSAGFGGIGAPLANTRWGWMQVPKIGGRGSYDVDNTQVRSGTRGNGGGCLVLLIEGNADFTGFTVIADGAAGASNAGGGSGGSIVIVCTGTLTGGTFKARGAAGGGASAGCGGGGYIALVASVFAGVQTFDVSKGGSSGFPIDGTDGGYEQITLTQQVIRGLMFRSY